MFAVIKTGGRHTASFRMNVLEIGKIAGDVGTIVQLGEVLLVGGESPVLGAPRLRVPRLRPKCCSTSAAEGDLVQKRRRKNSKRKRGYRDEITVFTHHRRS